MDRYLNGCRGLLTAVEARFMGSKADEEDVRRSDERLMKKIIEARLLIK